MAQVNAPLTKADLDAQLRALKADLRGDLAAARNELVVAVATAKDEMRAEMVANRMEITRHFDVVAENLHRDLRDAHHDQIEILKDHDKDHVRRIRRLEDHAGLIV